MGAEESRPERKDPPTNITQGFGCDGPNTDLDLRDYDMGNLGDEEVEIHVTHCGVCHTDIMIKDNQIGISQYPVIPGHETVGIVKYVGSKVTKLKPGMRVGVGWHKSVCEVCQPCKVGRDNLCTDSRQMIVGRPNACGGYARAVRVDENLAFPIPANMKSAVAAPLFCAGITMYAPLARHCKRKGMKVGVAGLGGLGSIGVQLAKAMGHTVVGISRNEKKRDLALKTIGCDDYLAMNVCEQFEAAKGTFDFVINTIPANIDFQPHLDLLGPAGTYCVVGVSTNDMKINAVWLLTGEKTICGSCVGSKEDIQSMLRFCSKHNIEPKIFERDFSEVNDVLKELVEKHPLGRFVLVNKETQESGGASKV